MTISTIGGGFSNSGVTTNAQARAQQLMKQMDADGDGKVSKQELTAFGENMKAKGPRRLSGGEAAAPQGANTPAPPSVDDMFAKADTDGDGALSIENLSAMISQHETHAAARAPHPSGPHPGGPPPDGGHRGNGAAGHDAGASSNSSSSSSSASSDPADTDHDGKVSAAEKLIYQLSHPTASFRVSELGASRSAPSSTD